AQSDAGELQYQQPGVVVREQYHAVAGPDSEVISESTRRAGDPVLQLGPGQDGAGVRALDRRPRRVASGVVGDPVGGVPVPCSGAHRSLPFRAACTVTARLPMRRVMLLS